ncbi:MAG: serine/threonine protein kinase [Labilithrix sp.]|nr:serine/threonine protein kinase [Labilithrix sp.]
MERHPLLGTLLADTYRLDSLLHEGRRNDLFVAEDAERHRWVLKIPRDASNAETEILAREAAFLSAIDHPNVVAMQDIGADGMQAYLALEALEGETLAEAMERLGAMEAHEVLTIFWQVLAGVKAMHEADVIHRDLRPRNVFLVTREQRPPIVKLIDFASGKLLRPDHPDTSEEPPYPIGAHRYMAPEQHRGEIAGPWVDVYSVGVMLYAAFVGELPEHGTRVSAHREVSPAIDEVVSRALAEDRDERHASAAELQEALTRAILVT